MINPVKKIYNKNNEYQKLEVLKTNRNKRFKYNEFFVEGVRNINEALANGWKINSFVYSFDRKLSDWARKVLAETKTEMNYELAPELMDGISSKEDTSEIVAVMQMKADDYNNIRLGVNLLIVVFDRPSNKGNLGTIIRSCDAMGVDGLIITGHCVDLYDPETIAATMGSFFRVPVIREPQLTSLFRYFDTMKQRYPDLILAGTSAKAALSIDQADLAKPLIIMIGNETEGLCRNLKERSDHLYTIPMNSSGSASSLNVGCAASIIFYEINRQRRKAVNFYNR